MGFLFFAAVLSLFLGLVLIYQPDWILRFNRIMREKFFSDAPVLQKRRKHGLLMMVLALIFFSAWYQRGQDVPQQLRVTLISTDRMLYQSLQCLYAGQYGRSKLLAEGILAREPHNTDALYHLSAAQFLMQDIASGKKNWNKARKIDPVNESAARLKKMLAVMNIPGLPVLE
jgi:hypothetical protein